MVAGLAALVWSVAPSLTPDEVQEIIQNTAVDLGPVGKDNDYGHGRIDAAFMGHDFGLAGLVGIVKIQTDKPLTRALFQILENGLIPRVERNDHHKIRMGRDDFPLFVDGKLPAVVG